MDSKKLASYLDLANHHADATMPDIEVVCREVVNYGFNSAFVNPCYVDYAKDYTELVFKRDIKVGTVVDFPLGQSKLETKLMAAKAAIADGADELDISMDVGLLKMGQSETYLNQMKRMVKAVKSKKKQMIVKFIIETGYLSDAEIKKASELVLVSGADFVKTCSGLGPRGAQLKDVALIRQAVGSKIKVKVAGGIHNRSEALAFIKAGADRIGTSKAVEIVREKNTA